MALRSTPRLRLVPKDSAPRHAPLLRGIVLREAFPAWPFDPAAVAFAVSAVGARGEGPVLWVQDRMSQREGGRPCEAGMRAALGLGAPLLRVEVGRPREVLWAMEEGAGCAGLSAVIGEIHGSPRALDFTATKRLALRAEASGVSVWLIRAGGARDPSAARERWSVGSLPSGPHPDDPEAPGAPLWDAELFRARARAPGRWVAGLERADGDAAHRLRLAPPIRHGPPAPDRGAGRRTGGAS